MTAQALLDEARRCYQRGGGIVELGPTTYIIGGSGLPILPGVIYAGAGIYRTKVIRDVTPGPTFAWGGELGSEGFCLDCGVQDLTIRYQGTRGPDDIAIHLPWQPVQWPSLFHVHDLRIEGAYHGIKDQSGSFTSTYERLWIFGCSRGFEKALGTTTDVRTVFCRGTKNPAWDYFGFFLNGCQSTTLTACSVDEYTITPLQSAPYVFADTAGCAVISGHAEQNTVNQAVLVNTAGTPPEVLGLSGLLNVTHGGLIAPMKGWV